MCSKRWKLADSVSEKLGESSELSSQWRKSLLTAVFHWFTAVYKEQKNPQAQQEEAMLKRLQSLMVRPNVQQCFLSFLSLQFDNIYLSAVNILYLLWLFLFYLMLGLSLQIFPENVAALNWNTFVKSGLKQVFFLFTY